MLTDVGLSQMIKLSRRIPQPLDTTKAVYRITFKNEDDPATALAQDGRQKVVKQQGSAIEVVVQATHGPKPGLPAAKVADEFLQSSYFITCNDAKVKEHARKAVGLETDPWKKALGSSMGAPEHDERQR